MTTDAREHREASIMDDYISNIKTFILEADTWQTLELIHEGF